MDKEGAADILDAISDDMLKAYERYARVREYDNLPKDRLAEGIMENRREALRIGAHCLRNTAQAEKG